jgi:glutaredoxin
MLRTITLPLVSLTLACAAAAQNTAGLPLALRQTAGRYPVTLYAGKDCAGCDAGRQMLQQRGVPFTEKRVESSEDITAFHRLTGASNLPVLTIGGQQLKGLNSADWTSYLDAAGYPTESKLPANWRNPTPSPLVAAAPKPATPAGATEAPARRDDAPAPTSDDPTKPKIRF